MCFVRVGAFILFFFVASSVEAQGLRSFGLYVGANKSTVATQLHAEWRTGFHIAAFTEFLDWSGISLVTEVGYAQRGFVSKDRTSQATTTLHYISIPVLVRFRFLDKSSIAPYLVAGPHFDILVGRDPGNWEFASITLFEGGVSRYFEDVSYGAVLGVGASLESVVDRELRLELRYVIDATDLLNEVFSHWDPRNRSLNLSVGVAL